VRVGYRRPERANSAYINEETDVGHDPSAPGCATVTSRSRHDLSVVTPYRLDLTVSALRRLSMNVVDVLTPEGQYVRALSSAHGPVIVHAEQTRPDAVAVTIDGDVTEHAHTLALVRCMLGADRDVTDFDRAAARIPWLAPLAERMRGVKPPRYPGLWDACANAIVFQQVSLRAASTIMHRLIVSLGQPMEVAGVPVPLYQFPTAESVNGASDDLLRATGLSATKVATLRRVGDALATGTLDTTTLERYSSADASAILRRIKGIGPWSAAVILLRGLGRLDVFPANDTSVASNIALVSGSAAFDASSVRAALGEKRGMLYFYLLLARLEARGEIGRPSFERAVADKPDGAAS
jgi:DNA-3-methyladenine glycosylase II